MRKRAQLEVHHIVLAFLIEREQVTLSEDIPSVKPEVMNTTCASYKRASLCVAVAALTFLCTPESTVRVSRFHLHFESTAVHLIHKQIRNHTFLQEMRNSLRLSCATINAVDDGHNTIGNAASSTTSMLLTTVAAPSVTRRAAPPQCC